MQKKQQLVVIVLFVSMLLKTLPAQTQEYKGAVGARFGFGIGLTGLYHIRNGHVMEFLLRYGYHGLILNKPGAHVTALYEKHWELGRRSNFTAYVGGGLGMGIGKKVPYGPNTYFAFGFSHIVGFDYTTQRLRVPLILALDYKPAFHADFPFKRYGNKIGTDFSYYEVAFSVRVGIGRER